MRKVIFIALIALGSTLQAQARNADFDKNACTYKGVPLHGKVQVVNSFADFDVQVVNSFSDLNVQVVNSFANRCGQWRFVNSFPDFKIRYVNSFADFKIKMVNSFPGTP